MWEREREKERRWVSKAMIGWLVPEVVRSISGAAAAWAGEIREQQVSLCGDEMYSVQLSPGVHDLVRLVISCTAETAHRSPAANSIRCCHQGVTYVCMYLHTVTYILITQYRVTWQSLDRNGLAVAPSLHLTEWGKVADFSTQSAKKGVSAEHHSAPYSVLSSHIQAKKDVRAKPRSA